MAKTKASHSLTFRLLAVVCAAAIFAALTFALVNALGSYLIRTRYMDAQAVEKRTAAEIDSFRSFVWEHQVNSMDADTIGIWNREHRKTELTIYGKVMVVRSSAKGAELVSSESGLIVRTGENAQLREYPVNFADGAFSVAVTDLSADGIHIIWTTVSISIAAVFFLLIVLFYDAHVTSSIRRLGRQVRQVSRGALQKQILPTSRDEIGELALDVDAMRLSIIDKLQREADAWNANAQLITAISHDVRTPLTALMGYLEILSKGDLPPEQQAQFLQVCKRHAQRLRELTDELFDFFLVFGQAAPEQHPEEFDADTLLEQILGEHIAELRQQGCDVRHVTGDLAGYTMTVDLRHLRRVFDNLISNLRKYADRDKPIAVLVSAENGALEIHISNTVANHTGRVESTGIGLKTCEKLVSAMGGSFTRWQEDGIFTARIQLPLRKKE